MGDDKTKKKIQNMDDEIPTDRPIQFLKAEGGYIFWIDEQGNTYRQIEDCLGG